MKILLVVLVFVFNIAIADVPAEQLVEIDHLLAFVKNSGCIISRNGTSHPAAEGVSHIRNKYDYFLDDIKSTEDFITYSASKSTMSGRHYMVTCPGKESIKTQDWLLTELKQFRSK